MKWLLATLGLSLLLMADVSADQGRVVASTPWTAAFARAAGATDILILAPSSLRDPMDYVLSASDLDSIRDADWVIYSGAESFAEQLESAARGSAQLLQLHTENSPETIRLETKRVAELLGTMEVQSAWIGQFEGVASRVKAAINTAYPEGTRAIAHSDQAALARWLGFEVVGQIGTTDLTESEISALAATLPEIVLDSYHQPTGTSLAESAGALYVQLISQPGLEDTTMLEDVLRYNQDQLVSFALPEAEKSSAETALPLLAAIAAALLVALVFAAWRLRRLANG